MKGIRILCVVLGLVVCACLPFAASAEPLSPGGIPMVSVTAVMAAPEKHPGVIRVRGLVGAVYPDAKQLGLIDPLLAGCCANPCEPVQSLPVRWTGVMPEAKKLVVATGEIQRTGKKLEFVARSIEPIQPAAGVSR